MDTDNHKLQRAIILLPHYPMFVRLCYLLAFLVCALSAGAHPNLQNALWVQFEPRLVRVAINVSAKEISVAQQISINESDFTVPVTAVEQHGAYLLNHLTLTTRDGPLLGKVVKFTALPEAKDAEAASYQYEMEFPCSERPSGVRFQHTMLQEWPYAVGTAWDINYSVRTKRSDLPEVATWLLRSQVAATYPTGWPRPDGTTTAPPSSNSNWQTFGAYLHHGLHHILTGYDHLLFVSALVIATLSFWEMLKVIAAFTLAHTLTLALSVFNVVRLPAGIVEPVIAASIVFVALENLLSPQRAHSRARLAVAFGFGLVHGLGFAGGLLEAMEGLPKLGLWIALLAFSLGVELGHQLVVLPSFGLLRWSQRKVSSPHHRLLLRTASAGIACGGVYFLIVALRQLR